jgi:hypothetical protein
MQKIKTRTLFISGVALFFASSLFMRGVTVLKPVKDSNGVIVHRPDGRILFQEDVWGGIKVNWDAYLLMLIGSLLIIWSLVRIIIYLCRRKQSFKL